MPTASTNNNTTPAEQAMALLHETQNGGWAVRSATAAEFDAIPCEHEVDAVKEREVYIYEGCDGDSLVLSLAWGDEEFFIG